MAWELWSPGDSDVLRYPLLQAVILNNPVISNRSVAGVHRNSVYRVIWEILLMAIQFVTSCNLLFGRIIIDAVFHMVFS